MCSQSLCYLTCRNGNIQARRIELVAPTPPPRCQGVVCSMKDSFGFIERADVVKEIFFHYSEYNDDINDLVLGDDVEFDVQTRNVSSSLKCYQGRIFNSLYVFSQNFQQTVFIRMQKLKNINLA